MFCFNLCLLIHNRTHLDCQRSDVCLGSFDWRLSTGFPLRFPRDLAQGGRRLIYCYVPGWEGFVNSGWGITGGNVAGWESSGRFDWRGVFFFPLSSPFQHKRLPMMNEYKTKETLGTPNSRWGVGELKLLFHLVSLSPSVQVLVGRQNIKGRAPANTTIKLLPQSLDWIWRRLPAARPLWLTRDSLASTHATRCHWFQTFGT